MGCIIEKVYFAYLSPGKRLVLPNEYMALDLEVFIGEKFMESRIEFF